MFRRRCPPTGACALGAWSCASGPLRPACAPYSEEHSPRPTDVGRVGDQVCKARRVGGRLVASHQYRTPGSVFPDDPTTRLASPPSPEDEPPGFRETACATPRQALDPEQQGSD